MPEAKLFWHRLYKTARWRRLRRLRLQADPLCVMCKSNGVTTAAVVVDHIEPHKGDQSLFYSYENTQSLCAHHHSSSKQSHEVSRIVPVGVDGWPCQ